MPLPLKFVKEIHSRLAVRYGSAWRAKWAEVPQEALEADWADQLNGMQPAGIRKALESLPHDFPPTASAFRLLGVMRDEAAPVAALPAPDPAGLKRIAQSIAPMLGRMEPGRVWMARLEREVMAGTASAARVRHYRIAVANGAFGGASDPSAGDFTPPAESTLPPGMRPAVNEQAATQAEA